MPSFVIHQVPNAHVLIVGTHADHPSLTRATLEEIWLLLRHMLAEGREHHRRYFAKSERQLDCLLCQSDSRSHRKTSSASGLSHEFVNLGFEDGCCIADDDEADDHGGTGDVGGEMEGGSLAFPHIIGYYEVYIRKTRFTKVLLKQFLK